MRRSFPEFAADWLLTSLVVCSEIGGKSADTLRGNFLHDRGDEEEESGTQLSGKRTRDKTSNDSANRSADSNKAEKPLALLWCENVSHKRPKHRCGKEIEDADPDEKYGRKDHAFLRRWHCAHEQEENEQVRDGEAVCDRNKPAARHPHDNDGIKRIRD